MKGRELGNEEYEKFKDGLDRYVKIQGIDSKLSKYTYNSYRS